MLASCVCVVVDNGRITRNVVLDVKALDRKNHGCLKGASRKEYQTRQFESPLSLTELTLQ
jgi:hypothetical protein